MSSLVEIQFKYAVNEDGEIVDIACLDESDRKDYECAGCGKIVRPVLGKIRKKHFRHIISADCSVETYLHRMGKMLFERQYRESLQKQQPFYVEFSVPVVCTHCIEGPCNVSPFLRKYDLTKAFTSLQNEHRDGNLIPDIFLQTSTGEILYIEIFVTHAVSEEKINSGKKIIEIQIKCEKDLELIKSGFISCKDHRVKLYNFDPKAVEKDDPGLCQKQVIYFIVYPSGKCAICVDPTYFFIKLLEDKKYYVKRLFSQSGKVFVEEAEAAYNKGTKVKNCFLCRYHALAKPYQRENDYESIFCKFLKKIIASNFAAECEYYKPDPNVFGEQRFANKGKAQNNSLNKFLPVIEQEPAPISVQNSQPALSKSPSPEQPQTIFASPSIDHVFSESDSSLNSLLPANAKPYEFLAICIFCGKETADWWSYDGNGNCKCQDCYKRGLK